MRTHTTSGAQLDLLGSPSVRRKGGSAGPQPFVLIPEGGALLVNKVECSCRATFKNPNFTVDMALRMIGFTYREPSAFDRQRAKRAGLADR